MPLSPAMTAWTVTGALGVTSFAVGLLAAGQPAAAPPEPRPAVTVTANVPPSAQATPSQSPTATPSPTATRTHPATPRATPGPKPTTATMVSPPSPVSARSAKSPD